MHEDLLGRRGDYPILARKTYLINNSLGAMHRDTPARLARYAEEWAGEGVSAWEHWLPEMRRIADLLGAVVGAPPGTTVLRQSVADAVAAVASGLDFAGPRNRVVCTDQDWPGSHYLWTAYRRYGAEVVVVPTDGVSVDPQRVADAVDDRTALVAVSQVMFRSSALLDVAPVVQAAHRHGALVLLDAYQAAGSVPVRVAETGVDVCVGGSVKYLCGGPGNGWLYVAPGVAERLRPVSVGWFSHAAPFDFAFDAIDYAPGVARFTGGTPNVAAAYAAEPGYRAVLDVGVHRIRERSVALTQPLLEGALERGFTVRSPHEPHRRGGHVTIDPGRSAEVAAELLRRDVVVDHRPGSGIRVAPHFYNTAQECAAVLAEMDVIRKELG